jgi:AraC-like DNA-binding protein
MLRPAGLEPQADGPDAALWKLLRAEMFIAEHLSDPHLSALAAARNLDISVRHLNRLFAARQTTATKWIWSQRLARATEDLALPRARSVAIGEVAFRWAFANQAHFARCFKVRHGITPTEYRRQALATATTPVDQ